MEGDPKRALKRIGQYFKAIQLQADVDRPKAYCYSHDFGSGLKLMEHSWVLNPFVRFFEQQLINNPQRIVWAGDYADGEKLTEAEIKEYAKRLFKESTQHYAEKYITKLCLNPSSTKEKNNIILAGIENELHKDGLTLYSMCDSPKVTKLTHNEEIKGNKWDYEFKCLVPLKETRYLVNHTKKEYIDKNKTPNNDGWRVHPLPLLCCNSNQRGGGDFYSEDKTQLSFIGRWVKDKIEVVSVKTKIPKGYTEIKPNFEEK